MRVSGMGMPTFFNFSTAISLAALRSSPWYNRTVSVICSQQLKRGSTWSYRFLKIMEMSRSRMLRNCFSTYRANFLPWNFILPWTTRPGGLIWETNNRSKNRIAPFCHLSPLSNV